MLPILVLVGGLVTFFLLGGAEYLAFETFRDNRGLLLDFVERNGFVAVLAYMAVYAVAIALSLPGGAVLTLTGGFLFGVLGGGAITVVGATIGATALFLAARMGLGEPLRARAGPAVKKIEAEFQENAWSYLLFLRLVPLFPFWMVNLALAFLGVELKVFVITTMIGIIPGTFVYASLGNGLGVILDQGGSPDLGIIFQPEILLPLVGLSVLALIPVVYKRFKARQN
ncbi:MAG: TVP38/TMEM64 family protein [Alphaproteobacteria bacterium]|nr:TVP38/TMEM64 family protein [Alphaproteobacteria bacterium]